MQQYAVIGLGRFGSRLAINLAEEGAQVVGIDRDEAIVEQMRDRVTLAVAMDATDERALRAQGIEQIDAAVVGIGADFESTVLTTVVLKQLGVPRLIARAGSARAAAVLSRVGADEVVNPEDEAADRWAQRLLTPQFLGQYELESGYRIVELAPPRDWLGRTLTELDLRRQAGVHVIAVKRRSATGRGGEQRWRATLPSPAEPIQASDVLVLLGGDEDLKQLIPDQA
jgi:trk system potassium uptake protein TrkA